MKMSAVLKAGGVGTILFVVSLVSGATITLRNGLNGYNGMQDKTFYTTDGNGDFNSWGSIPGASTGATLPEYDPITGIRMLIHHQG